LPLDLIDLPLQPLKPLLGRRRLPLRQRWARDRPADGGKCRNRGG
jgi:hypothetical protein